MAKWFVAPSPEASAGERRLLLRGYATGNTFACINEYDFAAVGQPDSPPATFGHAYHWKSHAVLSEVDVVVGEVGMAASKPLGGGDLEHVISAADVLAALKIASARNLNSDPDGIGGSKKAPQVSPYQIIAADVIETDGIVTSADAIAILKAAVNDAVARRLEW